LNVAQIVIEEGNATEVQRRAIGYTAASFVDGLIGVR